MQKANAARTRDRVEKRLPRAEPRRKAAQRPAHHVSADFLILHILGDLPIFQRLEVEDHLAVCPACRNELRETAGVITVFRTGS